LVAQVAVLRAPLRSPASTTMTARESAAIRRFRQGKRRGAGGVMTPFSEMSEPAAAISWRSCPCADG
jgi:hypothetical protein